MYWPAFILGLLGSLHCAAMCSPILLSIPWKGITSLNVMSKKLFYQAGRLSTYVLIGMSLYLGGRRILIGNIQQSIGIVVGAGLIVYALLSLRKRSASSSFLTTLYLKLTKPFGNMLRSKSLMSRFGLGALNGLLPCGLVYVAAFTALTQNSVGSAGIYMLAFGIGTLPMILGIFASSHLLKKLRTELTFKRLKPVIMVLIGGLFIVRSLELGIPVISPVLEVAGNGTAVCAP